MRKSTTKVLSAILVAGMTMSMLAGCGDKAAESTAGEAGGGTADASATPAADSAADQEAGDSDSKEKKEITLMASQNWIKDVDNELFDAFEKETGIKVKVSLTPDNEYKTLLGTTLSGGSDAVDMFMYPAGSEMESGGIPDVAVDLSGEQWVANLEKWAVDANSYDGKVIGFSTWGIDYEGVLYNKTYFEENNLEVPATWDEFIALCDQIKGLGKTPLYEGINGTWHTQSWVYGMTPCMAAEKPDFVEYLNQSKDNKLADITCLKTGLEQLAQLLSAKDGNNPKYYTNDGQAEDWFGSYTSLQEQETVMMFTYSSYAAELAANGATDEFGMFPVPLLDNQTAVSNGGGVSKFINKNSKAIDECKELLNFLAKKENLETYYAARTDLVTSSFKDVESVKPTTATTEIMERSKGEPVVMGMKTILYWDPDMYKYLQGFADGSVTADQFIENADNYRATMFDTAE